jgi:hypothetical protein
MVRTEAEALRPRASGAALEPAVRDDALARGLLQRAQGALQKWPDGFIGFAATIRCREGARVVTGEVRVFAGGGVETTLPCPDLRAWVETTLGAIARARTPRFFKDGDGRYPISLGPDDGHPLGRQVHVHRDDGTGRMYRIDPRGRLRQEERVTPTARLTTTFEEYVRTCPGRLVPRRTRVLALDMATGSAMESADIVDDHCRVDHVWLPARRRAVLTIGDVRRILGFDLEGHAVTRRWT